ncbi:cysteine desulfurase family protein [Aquibacillus kalidii]|uniref:cysteine desulfurase family protein n=1 Tax=Aquibacillus kalidii TaxID=2762597 RepID=UPI001648A843|nr:cysteine desulfurase family protein [Aquibacillus kalidii]
MIYLDNSATTKPYPEVIDSFSQVAQQFYGNPSSIHSFGLRSERLLNQARKQAAHLIDVDESEIVFTSGGTEGNNMAIKGIAFAHQNRGKHIITSQIEHPSVLETCRSLEEQGFRVTYLPVNNNGVISPIDLEKAITEETILVSIMHVNNELGTIQPIQEVGQIVSKYPKVFFHVDHVQGFGKISLDFYDCLIDLVTISGHKIHGLRGTGILFVKKGTKISPLFHGGEQENKFRAGTENLASIVSMVKAVRLILEQQQIKSDQLRALSNKLKKSLKTINGIMINTPEKHADHIVNISIPGYKPEVIIHALAEKDIFISTKSACSSKQPDESAILVACGFDKEIRNSGLRISLSYENTIEEIEQFCTELQDVLLQLSGIMR